MLTKLRPKYRYCVVNMCDLWCENVHLTALLIKNEFIDSVTGINILFCYLE